MKVKDERINLIKEDKERLANKYPRFNKVDNEICKFVSDNYGDTVSIVKHNDRTSFFNSKGEKKNGNELFVIHYRNGNEFSLDLNVPEDSTAPDHKRLKNLPIVKDRRSIPNYANDKNGRWTHSYKVTDFDTLQKLKVHIENMKHIISLLIGEYEL